MNISKGITSATLQKLWVPIAFVILWLTVVFTRPLIPIDETRYMSVAWEMYLRHDWLAPLTLNFAPYYQKPPLLFWLINLVWSIVGVSRWAATIPMILAAIACLALTNLLARKLFDGSRERLKTLSLLMMGSIPFLVSSTLIMFDVTLTAFVLCALCSLVVYAETRQIKSIVLMSLALSLAVLTKGPVAWLCVIFPVLLGPYWIKKEHRLLSWYFGCLLAFLLSVIPVLGFMSLTQATTSNDIFRMVWEKQTLGRITGNSDGAHVRPFYFYLLLLPAFFLPWILFPTFWKGLFRIKKLRSESGLRFLACWLVPTFLVFLGIRGKQAHYLLPLLPGGLILISFMEMIPFQKALSTTIAILSIFVAGHIVAVPFLKPQNLQPIAHCISQHADRDVAFTKHYQGEITFLARLEKPVENIPPGSVARWLQVHPNGIVVMRYKNPADVAEYKMILSIPYRKVNLGVFTLSEK